MTKQENMQQGTKIRARNTPTTTPAMMPICSVVKVVPAQEKHTKTDIMRTSAPTKHMHKKAQRHSLLLASSAACIGVNCPGDVLQVSLYVLLIEYPQ